MTDRAQQAADALAALGSVTAASARRTLSEFAVRDQVAALAVAAERIQTIVQEVTFEDFALIPEAPPWPGRAPYMTIPQGTVVFGCYIFVTELFNDSAPPTEIQVTSAPDGASVQLSNAPSPTALLIDGNISRLDPSSISGLVKGFWMPDPSGTDETPIIGMNGWAGDGTAGRAVILTTFYTPVA